MAPSRLGRVVVVQQLSLLLLVVALVLAPDPVDGLAVGGGGQPGAGVGGYAVGRPPLDGGRERLGRRLLGDVEVTETPGQGGDHPGPLLVVGLGDRLPDVDHAHRNGRTSIFRLQCLRPLGGELERHVEVGGLDDPEAGEILLRLQEGPVGEHRLLASVVDDGGRAGRREATGEDPVALRLEPVVEHVDGRHLVRGGEAGRVVDHGNQVLHLGSSPVVRGAPRGRPLTPATNTSAPIRHRLPDFFRGLSGTPVVSDPTARRFRGDRSGRSAPGLAVGGGVTV